MTKDEALKLALEALERLDLWLKTRYSGIGLVGVELEAITAIKEALAQPEQEPVAVKHMMEWVDYLKRKSDYGQHMKIPSEMSAGACWELAIELEQFINTTPPQRTWVNMTADEVDQGLLRTNYAMKTAEAWRHGVEWAQFNLMKKNT